MPEADPPVGEAALKHSEESHTAQILDASMGSKEARQGDKAPIVKASVFLSIKLRQQPLQYKAARRSVREQTVWAAHPPAIPNPFFSGWHSLPP